MRRKPVILLSLSLAAVLPLACAKPPVDASTGTSVSVPPGNPTSGSGVTTTAVGGATTTAAGGVTTKVRTLPCDAMSRFVQDLFIVEKAKDEGQTKKDEILAAVEGHATELKTYVPALASGVDVRMEYVRAFLTTGATPAQKEADEAQGKLFEAWFKGNNC